MKQQYELNLAKNHQIHFGVSRLQMEKIAATAKNEGFSSVADFCRKRILGNNLILEQQVAALYRKLCENKKPYEVLKPFDKASDSPVFGKSQVYDSYKPYDGDFDGIGNAPSANTKSIYTGKSDYNDE